MQNVQSVLLTRQELSAYVKLGRSTIYSLMRQGKFPEPIQVGPQAVRWVKSEIDDWLAARPRATGESSKQAA